jgi:methyl-accepting chemotaxis protein
MDQVVQQNASGSEELAATAEELSAQATKLVETVGFFKVAST